MTRLTVSHARMGFHWAPFNSIEHLHLHLLYPVEQMSLISRLVFMPNYFWFSEVRRAHETLMNDDYLMTIDLQPLRFFLFNTAGRKDSRVSEGENRSCRSQLGAFDFISINHTCRWLVAQINDRLATASLAVIAHAIAIAGSRVPTGSNRHINSGACQGARRGENPILRVSDWADVCVCFLNPGTLPGAVRQCNRCSAELREAPPIVFSAFFIGFSVLKTFLASRCSFKM